MFLGEFECTVDAKGRILFPAVLRRQLAREAEEKFIIKNGFEDCLNLYPLNEWKRVGDEISKLNPYVEENRTFIRSFLKGATEMQLDNVSRLLLPKRLLESVGIKKDIVLFANTHCIEIWDKVKFDNLYANEDKVAMSKQAERVMGNIKFGETQP